MADTDINASVDPAIRRVTEGDDAVFLCNVSGDDVGTIDIAYNWVAHSSVISERRFRTTDGGQGFIILRTNGAENNTDVTCSVRSFETKELITSGKSRLIVMPFIEPITSPQELTATKATTKQTRTSFVPTTTLSQHETQTPTDVVGKTSQIGSQGIAPIAIISGAIVGGILLLLVLLLVLLILWRNKKRQQLAHRASFSGRHTHESDVPQMKRYVFMDHTSGEKMAFSETDGFDSPHHHISNNRSNQEKLRTYSRGSAPDILASCGLDTPDPDNLRKMPPPGQNGSESSLSQHTYESITPTYIVPSEYTTIDDGYTDINIGQMDNEEDPEPNTKDSNHLEVTNNVKNSTNGGPPLDRFGYVELNIDPGNYNISSEDLAVESTQQTEQSGCLNDV